jgi:two-component system LytT family sensor kinase
MIIQKNNSRFIAIIIHVLVWGVFGLAIFFYQPLTGDIPVPYQLWIKQLIALCLLAGAYYINSGILMPNFLLKSRTGYYFFFIVLTITAFLLLNKYSDQWLDLPRLMQAAFRHQGHHRPDDHSRFDLVDFIIIALVLGIGTSITAIQKWQADKQSNLLLQQEKISSELSFLKAQINPHFFFNTLNNIYALTYVDAETSREAIHQLSRMMRYLLYEAQQSHTLLSQEINFIKDFINLMQLRLTDMVTIKFEQPENLVDIPVAPMIFLPFVENAFKHGTSVNEPSEIDIEITQYHNQLKLKVKNTIIKNPNIPIDEYGGIGLENTRRRLDILYPGKHELLINTSTETNEYLIHLTLDL